MADSLEILSLDAPDKTLLSTKTNPETASKNGAASGVTVAQPLHELISATDKVEAEKAWVIEKAKAEVVGKRGEEIYQQQIRHKVEAAHRGKYLILDVDSGCYEIDTDIAAASLRLYEQHPDARLYTVRIGYPSAVKL